jgi:hypothetical protein
MPHLTLPAQLAVSLLDAELEQPSLQLAASIARVLDENFLEWDLPTLARSTTARVRIEMAGIDVPGRGVTLDRPKV